MKRTNDGKQLLLLDMKYYAYKQIEQSNPKGPSQENARSSGENVVSIRVRDGRLEFVDLSQK